MHDVDRLLERLRKIEALHARPGTDGERAAAATARDRIRRRLREMQTIEHAIEHRFTLHDPWARTLFIALAGRHGLIPYRRPRQHQTTLLIRAKRSFVNDTLWPQYCRLYRRLYQRLDEATQRTIAESL